MRDNLLFFGIPGFVRKPLSVSACIAMGCTFGAMGGAAPMERLSSTMVSAENSDYACPTLLW